MEAQSDTKAWIKAVAAHLDLTLTDLAKGAGVGQPTITRYVNDKTGKVGISQRTLDAVSRFSGVPPHQMPPRGTTAGPDAVPYTEEHTHNRPPWLADVMLAAQTGQAWRKPWSMVSHALDLAGVQAGDILVVDSRVAPTRGDTVLAQVFQGRDAGIVFVVRVFEPPFLLTRSSTPTFIKPLIVDGDGVVIRGVVDLVLRAGRR